MDVRCAGRSSWVSTCFIVLMFPLNSIVLSVLLTFYLLFLAGIYWRAFMLTYLLFIYFDRSPARGGHHWAQKVGLTAILRKGFWWRVPASYFPASLHRTAKLPAEKSPYIFVCHPHGIFGIAIQTSIGTDATGFDELFPGIRVHLMGLKPIFAVPFFREWVLMHAHATPGAKTISGLLEKKDSVALAVGGAQESLDAFPGTYKLTMGKGFVRLAMRGGAMLVPVISFGENELYTQLENKPGSKLRWIQLKLKATFGFTLPLFCGRSWLPLVPKSVPLATIVGAPVKVPHIPDPTEEQVTAARELYVTALSELFKSNKQRFGFADLELQIEYRDGYTSEKLRS